MRIIRERNCSAAVYEDRYYRFFTQQQIEAVLKEAGLEIVESFEGGESDGMLKNEILIHARKPLSTRTAN